MTGVESLPSVKELDLHGGPFFLGNSEPDDEDIDMVLVALRSVERVVVRGDGISWVHVPKILRRLAEDENMWKNVVAVEFGRAPHCEQLVSVLQGTEEKRNTITSAEAPWMVITDCESMGFSDIGQEIGAGGRGSRRRAG